MSQKKKVKYISHNIINKINNTQQILQIHKNLESFNMT